MKPSLSVFFGIAVLLIGANAIPAQDSALEDRLARGLKLYPEADADKDGKLSLSEARDYVEKHPELKAQFGEKAGGGGSKSTSRPASYAPGAEGTRVFVCAHSYMIYTADTLPLVAKAASVSHLKAGQQMIGGSRVIQHWMLPDEDNQAKKSLREGIVDVLMLSPHLNLPDEGIDNFTKLGLEKNPKLRVLVQASWPPRDGNRGNFKNEMRNAVTVEDVDKMRDSHNSSFIKKLEVQVRDLNASVGHEAVFIVPVSDAVFALRKRIAEGKAPALTQQSEMFRDDHGHPADSMALLVTYCHFAAIYQRSPVGLAVPSLLKDKPQKEELNRMLQEIAWDAIISRSHTKRRGILRPAANKRFPSSINDKTENKQDSEIAIAALTAATSPIRTNRVMKSLVVLLTLLPYLIERRSHAAESSRPNIVVSFAVRRAFTESTPVRPVGDHIILQATGVTYAIRADDWNLVERADAPPIEMAAPSRDELFNHKTDPAEAREPPQAATVASLDPARETELN